MNYKDKILELIQKEDPPNPLEYINSIVRPMMRNKLDNAIKYCKDCPKCCNKIKSVTFGHDQASIMIIGESIIKSQLNLNKKIVYPFEGTEEMNILNQIFEMNKINTNQLFWINAMNCYPYEIINNKEIKRAPTTFELNNCKLFLNKAIEIMNPVFIILLGNISMNVFHKGIILQEHGKMLEINGIPAMPIYSPEYLLQMSKIKSEEMLEELENDFIEDFSKAFQYIKNQYNNIELEL